MRVKASISYSRCCIPAHSSPSPTQLCKAALHGGPTRGAGGKQGFSQWQQCPTSSFQSDPDPTVTLSFNVYHTWHNQICVNLQENSIHKLIEFQGGLTKWCLVKVPQHQKVIFSKLHWLIYWNTSIFCAMELMSYLRCFSFFFKCITNYKCSQCNFKVETCHTYNWILLTEFLLFTGLIYVEI